MIINKIILEAKIQVDMDNYDKLAPKLKDDDIISVIDENGEAENVTYLGPMKGEKAFTVGTEKYIYVWGSYDGKKDIAVLSIKDDKVHSKKWLDKQKDKK